MTVNTAQTEEILEITTDDQGSMEGKYLTFKLADEGYGLEICYVTEIIGVQPVTAVPDMPHHVIGVLNLRGKIIPIIDVRRRFNLPSRSYDDRTCIIVVHVSEQSVGLVVDKVSEVIDIPEGQIEPPPRVTQVGLQSYVQGMGKIDQNVKILLDVKELLQDEDLSIPSADTQSIQL